MTNEPTTAKLRKEWEDDVGRGFDWMEEDVEDLHNKFGILLKRLEAAEPEIKELRSRLEAADLESWLDSPRQRGG